MSSWYSVDGSGDPVVLLHGGLSDSTAWGSQLPALIEHQHKVFVTDRRGHGRTADTDAPFSYDDMASETVEFLEQVVAVPPPSSDGATAGSWPCSFHCNGPTSSSVRC